MVVKRNNRFETGDLVRISPDNDFRKLIVENDVSPEFIKRHIDIFFGTCSAEENEVLFFLTNLVSVVNNNEIGIVINSYRDGDNDNSSNVLFPSGKLGLKNGTLCLVKPSAAIIRA